MITFVEKDPHDLVRKIATETIAPLAAEIDRERRFPAEAFKRFSESGLLGLLVPKDLGGMGGTLTDLVNVTETIAEQCGSTAMCYLMHSCATMVIAAKASAYQQDKYLKPIARGELIGTLAFSESATGAHFYTPEIKAEYLDGEYVLSGDKSFVTNGDRADFMLLLTNSASGEGLDVLIVDRRSRGVQFSGEWNGIGMSGNNSISLHLDQVRVPENHLIGEQGSGMDILLQVVAPTFILGVSGVSNGLARGAYQAALDHASNRRYAGGQTLADMQAIQFYLAEMHGSVESTSLFTKNAAKEAVEGKDGAVLNVMQSKILAAQNAQAVTAQAMQVCGGKGYTPVLPVERYFRDARACSVMGPTTEVLKEWVGKSVAGLPLF